MVSSAHPEHYLVRACNEFRSPYRRILDSHCYHIRLKLFGHVARADKSQDHSRALQACISPAPSNWRRRPGRPRHTWLRTVEGDLCQFNLGFASGIGEHKTEKLGGHSQEQQRHRQAPIDDTIMLGN